MAPSRDGIDVQHSYTTHYVGVLDPEVDAGAHITALFAKSGAYTRVLLAQDQTYNLQTPIFMREDFQEIATQGYALDDRRAKLYTRGENEATAINGIDKQGIVIRNLYINGCREEYGWLEGSGAIIIIGGWHAVDPVLADCVLTHPRGWSCCHLVDGSQGGRIVNNEIGPSGQPPPNGPWADGLSIACKDGLIAGNTILDATDGAIVIFCAPGTLVTNNTIIARTRNCLGAINLVDAFPFNGDYRNTRIVNNHIRTEGAFIHLAIGIGQRAWGDEQEIMNYGGTVSDNIIGPGRFGYGIAAASCRDFTVLSNRFTEDADFCGSMERISAITPPCALLRIDDGEHARGTFQSGFVEGPLRFLIGVLDKKGHEARYHAGALRWRAGDEEKTDDTATQSGYELEKARFELFPEGRLIAWDQEVQGRVLWDSATTSPRNGVIEAITSAALCLHRRSGCLVITTGSSNEDVADCDDLAGKQVVWDPMRALRQSGYECPSHDPFLDLRDEAPYLSVHDGLNTLWSSTNQWKSFDLHPGCFFAVLPEDKGRDENLQQDLDQLSIEAQARRSRAVFLWLDNDTAELVLHSSDHPQHPQREREIWRSPNWKKAQAEKATLQGDGNFVIYGKDGAGAVWATGTNATDRRVDRVSIAIDGEGGPRFELWNGSMVVWSSNDR